MKFLGYVLSFWKKEYLFGTVHCVKWCSSTFAFDLLQGFLTIVNTMTVINIATKTTEHPSMTPFPHGLREDSSESLVVAMVVKSIFGETLNVVRVLQVGREEDDLTMVVDKALGVDIFEVVVEVGKRSDVVGVLIVGREGNLATEVGVTLDAGTLVVALDVCVTLGVVKGLIDTVDDIEVEVGGTLVVGMVVGTMNVGEPSDVITELNEG